MFENKRLRIGTIRRTLSLPRFIYNDFVRWHWRRRHFSQFYFDPTKRRNPHIAIVGESGSGKSNLCKLLLKIISMQGAAFILLDPHNEYVEGARSMGAEVYDASLSGINIFDLDGFTWRERASEITSMLKRIFRLGEVQGYTLYKCIEYTYKSCEQSGRRPTIRDLTYMVGRFIAKARSSTERRLLESIAKRLSLIDGGAFSKSAELSKVLSGRSIFALSSLHTGEAQTLYIEGFLKKVYSSMLSMPKSPRPKLYIVIDEAEKVGDSSILSRLIAEGRKYGIGIVCISQRAKALNMELRSNSSLFISFSQREPEESNYIANLIACGNEMNRYIEVKKALRSLGRGSAIVLDSSARDPMIVSFDLFGSDFRDPTHAMLMLARGVISKHGMHEELRRAGFTPEEMDYAIKKLTGAGLIEHYDIPWGDYTGRWYIAFQKNSPEHDICVNLISRRLAEKGVRNVIHNTSYGPDVIAFQNGGSAAFEYETGANAIDQAKRMLGERRKKFAKVVVVANDAHHSRYMGIDGVVAVKASDFFGGRVEP
ncbi:MAG: ATP-binding protein [Candidatus Micrarchaeota archaeon]|nr:ATP-binding protein [Candidatus Micrarchaeota archaeon]